MQHQDWTPVVLRKTGKAVQKKGPTTTVEKHADSTGVNRAKLDDDPDYKTPTLTREMGKCITQARLAKNLTQKDLANKCNLQLSMVQQFEQGKGVYNRKHLDPICRVLGISLKK